jgi:NAD+--asparagine ADP-ribosyltransferase
METFKARRSWSEVFQALNENNFNPRILYPAKLSFNIDGATKVFHDKQKLKQYMTTIYKRLYKEFCTQKVKANKTMKGQAIPTDRRRKDKKVENNIDSATHNQTLKQQRQLNDRDHHVSINTNTKH